MKNAVIVVLLILLSMPCCAAYSAEDLKDALPESARELMSEMDDSSLDVHGGVSKVLHEGMCLFRSEIKTALKGGFLIASVCLVLNLIQGFASGSEIQLPYRAAELTGVTVILLLTMEQSGTLWAHCQETVAHLDRFNKVLTGIFAAATAVSGHPASASAMAAATLLFSTVILSVAKNLILPAAMLYLLMIYGGIVGENGTLRQAARVGKWAVSLFFKIALTAFFAYLTFTGLVTGSTDAAAVKTAQSLSSTVPLVGSVIASASETLLSGASVLRAGVGLFGTLAAVAICLAPLVKGFCHMLVFRVLTILTGSFSSGGVKELLEGLSNMYSMILGVLTACCAVQFIAIVVSMLVTNL